MTEGEMDLRVNVGADDVVNVTIGGDLIMENLSQFTEWTENLKKTIKETFLKKNKKVLVLADISGLRKYDSEVMVQLATTMRENEPYVFRNATYGGSQYVKMAEDVVAALSGRNNLKSFKTREEALNWLTEESS